MGYMIAFGSCFACKRTFGFNPDSVPSIRVNASGQPDPNGEKEPVCGDCMQRANAKRRQMGLPPHVIPADAYAPAPEHADETA